MGRASKFSPEVRERAVRLVLTHQGEHASQWAAIAVKLGEEDMRREQKRHRAEGRLLNLPRLGAENGSDLASWSAPFSRSRELLLLERGQSRPLPRLNPSIGPTDGLHRIVALYPRRRELRAPTLLCGRAHLDDNVGRCLERE